MTHHNRCRAAIELLNKQEGWQLDEQSVDDFATKLASLVLNDISEQDLLKGARKHCLDRMLVRDLLTPDDPMHTIAWTTVFPKISTIVRGKLQFHREEVLGVDDFIQNAHIEVVKSLKGFQFNCPFEAWLAIVVGRSVKQTMRKNYAKKRTGLTYSLDDNIAVGKDYQEENANAALLLDLIREVLSRHRDKRLVHIFTLAEVEGFSVAEIGREFQLHPSRIRALLSDAKKALRQDPSILSWLIGGE